MIIKRPAVILDRDPGAQTYFAAATFLPLSRWRDIYVFFRLSNRTEGQLKRTPGIVAYSLATDPLHRHFWTYSVWKDRAAVPGFVKAEPHATAVAKFQALAGEGAAFAEWETTDPRLDWGEAFERLKQPTFYYKKPA